jgi:8-oxo-dGTP diphosphatase
MGMSLPHIRIVAAEVERDGTFLITQRRPEAELPLLWEFPGGRVRDGESDSDALRRAIHDRLGCDVQVGHRVLLVTHAYSGYTLDMVVYRCGVLGDPQPLRVHAVQWVAPEQFGDFRFPGADQQTVDKLLRDA